jgi:alanine-glyoxylate transaminase/serine-glyoxylate transaminase/serine-pyruvate transaminase
VRHAANHQRLRVGLEALGIEFLVPEAARLPQLNAVRIPAGVEDAPVRKRLLEQYGIEIGAGLGPLAGKVWRIGLMGSSSSPASVDRVLAALGEVLGR